MVKDFTNSICDLTPQWAAEYGVTMIPDVIVFSPEEQYLKNLDVDALPCIADWLPPLSSLPQRTPIWSSACRHFRQLARGTRFCV